MSTFLNHQIKAIFLMLGSSCNLHCKYCMQSNTGLDHQQEDHLSPDLIPFIEEIAATATPQDQLLIQAYGGEPLKYWKRLRYIFDAIKDNKNINKSIISNGTLLTNEIITYLNTHEVSLTVSWDGPNTKDIRTTDILKNKEIVSLLRQTERLSISSVVSKAATPKMILDEAIPFMKLYNDATGNHCSINFDIIFDTGCVDKDLLQIDCDVLNQDMKILTGELKKKLYNQEHNPYYAHHAGVLLGQLTRTVKNHKTFKRATCCCGNGYDTYNVDMPGNLYRCHNTNEKAGHITDNYMSYLKNIILMDPTKSKINTCEHCPVVSMCLYGCPLIDINAHPEYCDARKAMYLPIVELLLELGEAAQQGNLED